MNLRVMVRASIADTQFEMRRSETPLHRCGVAVRGYVAVLALVFVSPFYIGTKARRFLAALLLAAAVSSLLLFSKQQNILLFGSAIAVGWLTSRRAHGFRMLGHMIAAVAIPFCAWLMFISVADGELSLKAVITVVDCALVIGLMFRATLLSVRLAAQLQIEARLPI